MKKILLLFFFLCSLGIDAFAQTHQVKGKVLDENGLGFPGAGVSVKGTQVGTVTDIDGNFSLDVPDGSNTLTIQAIGYKTLQVSATQPNITVHLQATARELQGAVVTALAVKREKRELGYNTTTLNNEEITAANNVSALSSLSGKVPGANITSSTGGPGGSVRVVLRGEKSISGNNNALIVIDGIIINNYDRLASSFNNNTFNSLAQVDFGNSANDINPEDIENVSVLQGPAASVLYGSAGANGVIEITTKGGGNADKKMHITVKETYTQSDVLKYPDFQNEFGQGNIYGGVPDDRRENFSWGYKFDGQMRPWGQIINGQELVKPYSAEPDNVKSFFNHGKDLNDYVSISGGDEHTNYFLSLNAINSTDVIPNSFYNRYSVRFNANTQLGNNFYSNVTFNYLNSYSRAEAGGQYAGSVFDNLLETARDIPIWELKNQNNIFYSMNTLDDQGVTRYGYYGAYYKNPYWVADNYDNRNKTDRFIGGLTVGYKKGKWNIFDRVTLDMSADRSFFISPKYNFQPYDPFYSGDNYVSAGGYAESDLNVLQFNNDVIARYNTDFSKDFGMTALIGNNIRMYQFNSLSASIDPSTNGLVIPGFYNFQNAQGPLAVGNGETQNRSVGAYGDINFHYKRTLYLEITSRNDWTSTLSPGNRSYFYPGVNASYVFTESMKPNNILTYGKVRAGYASVGNGAPAYANNGASYGQTTAASGFGSVVFPFNGQAGYQQSTVFGDPNLRPERTNEFEAGTDLSLFNDRLSVSFTYYNDLTHDLITTIPLAPSSGFFAKTINLGSVRNSGEEISLRVTPISSADFRWDLYGTYTHNVSDVISLANGLSQITVGGFQGMDIVAAVGRPMGAFYAIDVQRNSEGQVVVDPSTGLPLASQSAVYKGTYQPRFIASWGTDLSYKGLSLHLLFETKQGGVFFSRNKSNMDFNGTSAETAINDRQPYVWPNSVNEVVDPNSGQVTGYTKNTTKFLPYNYYVNVASNVPGTEVVDASYVRLQEAALTYTLPKKWYDKSPFGSLQVSVFGNNLLLWTAKSNQYDDPEETSSGAIGNGQGFNYTARPSLRNYGVSLKVTF